MVTTSESTRLSSVQVTACLQPHRKMRLSDQRIAVISERTGGWVVLDENAYGRLVLSTFRPWPASVLSEQNALGEDFRLLWDTGVLEVDGRTVLDEQPRSRSAGDRTRLTVRLDGKWAPAQGAEEENGFYQRLRLALSELSDKGAKAEFLLDVSDLAGPPARITLLLKRFSELDPKLPPDSTIVIGQEAITKEIVAGILDLGIVLEICLESAHTSAFLDRLSTFPELLPHIYRIKCFVSPAEWRSAIEMPGVLQRAGIRRASVKLISSDDVDQSEIVEKISEVYQAWTKMILQSDITDIRVDEMHVHLENVFQLKAPDEYSCNPEPLLFDNRSDEMGRAGADGFSWGADPAGGACLTCAKRYGPSGREEARLDLGARRERLRTEGKECIRCAFFGICGGTCPSYEDDSERPFESIDSVECAVRKQVYRAVFESFLSGEENAVVDYFRLHDAHAGSTGLVGPEVQDRLTAELRRLEYRPDEQKKRSRSLSRSYLRATKTDRKICEAALERLGCPERIDANFEERHMEAWADFLWMSTNAERDGQELDIPTRKALIVGWHHPEYPLGMSFGVRENILVLIARQALWMDTFAERGGLYNFKSSAPSSLLPRAFHDGRAVYAMMDFCYEGGAFIASSFLGQTVKVPAGVLKLSKRYGYEICVLSNREEGVGVIDSFPSQEYDLQGLADRINGTLEREILRDPARWLLWDHLSGRILNEGS